MNKRGSSVQMTAREAALKALGAFRRNKAWSELALSGIINNVKITQADAALATQIVYGVLQNKHLCDFYSAHFSTINLKRIEPRVLDVLRISIYQMVFLTRVPHSAAVNEGVALAKKFANDRAAGFVNALLRKVSNAVSARELPEVTGIPEYVLSVKYSHPEWLVREFCSLLGYDSAEKLLEANNSSDPLVAQVNTLLANTDEVISMLEADGVSAERHKWLEDCIVFSGAGNLTSLDAFKKGRIYIQDAASKLAVVAAGPKKGDFVIDGCAAPGGKSFTAAIMTGDSCRIAACDISPARLGLIKDGAERLGIRCIETVERDSSEHSDEYRGIADVVLADVPCSGFGVIRKKPEIRYKTEVDVTSLPDVQKRIISALSDCVAPGGTLLYSTCSVMKRENEDVVEWFLRKNSNFAPEAFSLPGIGEIDSGMVTLWPHVNGTDGFFICKLRKCRD